MPTPAANIHKLTLSNTFIMALNSSPCCINNNVSSEKVEKVVNAPKKPIPIRVR